MWLQSSPITLINELNCVQGRALTHNYEMRLVISQRFVARDLVCFVYCHCLLHIEKPQNIVAFPSVDMIIE